MTKCRGLRASPSQDALYAVFDDELVRINRNGDRTTIGTLVSSTGLVDFAFGTRQLVVVDGANGYVHTLGSTATAQITAPGWRGAVRTGYVRGVFLFHDPNTGVFYWSPIEDATTPDALEFATASNSPDNIVAILDSYGEATLLGEVSGEVWAYTGGDPAFSRNDGASMAVGCLAPFTARDLGGAHYWLGRDRSGAVRVYRARGYIPDAISDDSLDAKLAAAVRAGVDLRDAVAFGQADGAHGFYWLNIPSFDTTWVYDTKEGWWHERSDFALGRHQRHRAKHHAFCFGRHIVGGDSGDLWELDPTANTNAGDPLVRDRISPHYALPTGKPIKFGPFELDCAVGQGKPDGSAAVISLRYSDDGGKTWSDWRNESLGAIGRYLTRPRWFGNGSSTDRVWHVRCADDVRLAILRALVQGR